MFKRNLVLFLIFYFLALFQTSFFTYFFSGGSIPNLLLIFLFLLIFFKVSQKTVYWEVILAGFFLDLFSDYPFGFSIAILYLDYLFIKNFLKHLEKSNTFLFLLSFLLFLIFYDAGVFLFDYFRNFGFVFDKHFFILLKNFSPREFIHIASNLIFAFFGFIFYKYVLPRNLKKT